jgi:hypothetical protein
MAPSMFSDSADNEVVRTFLDSARAAFHPAGFRAMARASFEDQRNVLREIDVPMLLIYADHDLRAPVAVGEAIHAVVPKSELVLLRGPGHVSSVESADEVSSEIRRFLRQLDSQTALLTAGMDPYLLTHPLTRERIAFVERHVAQSPHSDARLAPDKVAAFERMKAKLEGFFKAP